MRWAQSRKGLSGGQGPDRGGAGPGPCRAREPGKREKPPVFSTTRSRTQGHVDDRDVVCRNNDPGVEASGRGPPVDSGPPPGALRWTRVARGRSLTGLPAACAAVPRRPAVLPRAGDCQAPNARRVSCVLAADWTPVLGGG